MATWWLGLAVALVGWSALAVDAAWEAEYELRELNCTKPAPGQRFPRCSLTEDGDFIPFECFPSKKGFSRTGRIRWYCSLRCEGATRTVDIQKYTHIADLRHDCVQFYSYHTEERPKDWHIWLDERCFSSHNVSFTVWCEYQSYRKRLQ